MKQIIWVVLVLALAASAVKASYYDGQALAEYCSEYAKAEEGRSYSGINAGICMGAIVGYAEVLGYELGYIYIPAGVVSGTLVKVVIKYMDDHPEKLHEPARMIAYYALLEAYPPKPEAED